MHFESLDELRQETAYRLGKIEGLPISGIKYVVVPYRICPLGAHVDHQGGAVLGRRINAFSVLAYAPIAEPVVRLQSLNYPGEVIFNLSQAGRSRPKDWGRYAQGAAYVLQSKRRLPRGIVGVVSGSMPDHGLSSSASVGLAYLIALAQANGIQLNKAELISLDRQLENDYLHLQNGIMDQAVIVHSIRNGLIYIDTQRETAEAILDPPAVADSRFIIASSGFPRELGATGYNDRVTFCRQAAGRLGQQIGLDGADQLWQIPIEAFEHHGPSLPAALREVATHYFSEVQRVEQGRIAWENGDLIRFGQLMNESNQSSVSHYKSGSEPLRRLQEITSRAPGVYGSRFSGGGYGGCVVGLVAKEALAEAASYIEGNYQAAYPAVAESARCYEVLAAGGIESR
jgi:galacturonokinase